MGSLPVLEVDDVMICQSHAIARYIAKKFGTFEIPTMRGSTGRSRIISHLEVETESCVLWLNKFVIFSTHAVLAQEYKLYWIDPKFNS